MADQIPEIIPFHTSSGELDAILARLTPTQVRLVIARIESDTDAQACRMIGLSTNTLKSWPQETRNLIRRAVSLGAQQTLDMALHLRHRALAKAMAVKVAGLDSHDPRERQATATEIIEWEIGKATDKVQVEVCDDLTPDERVRRMKALLAVVGEGKGG